MLVVATTTADSRDTDIISRLDRIPIWPYRTSLLWIVGIGFLIAFFDITNVAFGLPVIIKQLHLTSGEAAIPITSSLLGYILGSYLNSSVADIVGRKSGIFWATALFTFGSLATVFSFSLTWLVAFRFITGMGIGAEIAAIATYIGEMSPAPVRGRYTGWANVFSFGGFAVVPFVALVLVPNFSWGWRGMFFVGALAGLTMIGIRRIPESPRWLLSKGRVEEADSIVVEAEDRARAKLGRDLPLPQAGVGEQRTQRFPTGELLHPPYVGRLVLLLVIWIFLYLSDYAWLGLAPTFLVDKGFSLASSIVFLLVTGIGYPVGAILAAILGDAFERKYTIALVTLVWAVGLAAVGLFPSPAVIYVAGFILSTALALFFPLMYALTAESFPTRARASGVSLTDGVGHVGGALAPIIALAAYAWAGIASGFASAFLYMAITGLIAAILIPFGIAATRRSLEVVNR